MNASDTQDGAGEQLVPEHGASTAVAYPDPPAVAFGKTLLVSVVVALTASAVAWVAGDQFRVAEAVLRDRRRGEGVFSAFAELSNYNATKNGTWAYAILGATLALSLGVTAALMSGRRSFARASIAGLSGLVLGAAAGAASSNKLIPLFLDQLATADFTLSLLVHLGIWSSLGAAAGIAFGIGWGTRSVLIPSLVGGVTGAALAALLFDLAGVFFPLAHTEKPLSDEAITRVAGELLLGLCAAAGIVVVAFQKPRAKAPKS